MTIAAEDAAAQAAVRKELMANQLASEDQSAKVGVVSEVYDSYNVSEGSEISEQSELMANLLVSEDQSAKVGVGVLS